MHTLLSGDIKDIREVKSINFAIENEVITFTAMINTVFDNDWTYNEYKIGSYNLINGYGHIITSKGIKEYSNLKSLCKATWSFNPSLGFDINRVMAYKKSFKPEVSESMEIVEIKEELDSTQKMESESTPEATPTKNDKLIQGLKNSIAQVKEELNNIINTGDQISEAILSHPDTNKSPDKYSYEYKKLHDTLDYIDSIEDQLRYKLKLLEGKLYALLNTQLIESYSDYKYKVVLPNQTVFTNDYSEYIDTEGEILIKQLIYKTDNINASEVYIYHKYNIDNATYSTTREYNVNGCLTYEIQLCNNNIFYESIKRKDLTCNYYGLTGIKEVSYFSVSVPLQFIQVYPDNYIYSYWWRGNSTHKGITEAAQDKLRRFKEKYKNDLQVMEYLKLI